MRFVSKPLKKTEDISRPQMSRNQFLINGLLIGLVFYLLMLMTVWAGDALAVYIPDSWERKFADREDLNAADRETLGPAQAILEKLLAGEDLRDLDYYLFLMDSEDPNAFAVPGGGIGLTRGLLKQLKTERGLAFVIAHEIGHHQKKHILRRVGSGVFTGLIMTILAGADSNAIMESSFDLMNLSHSRDDEVEADDFALDVMQRKYGSTEDALEFFRLIQSQESDGFSLSVYSGTHPLTEDRIKRLEGVVEEEDPAGK